MVVRWILIVTLVAFHGTIVALLVALISLPIVDRIRARLRRDYPRPSYDHNQNHMREVRSGVSPLPRRDYWDPVRIAPGSRRRYDDSRLPTEGN
jgi:hypothetical protein